MNDEKTIKRKPRALDRVSLDAASLERVDRWIEQVTIKRKGVNMSRKELVNWLITSRPESLSAQEEKQLGEVFYNEVRFLQQALKELRAAKARGDSVTLQALLQASASPAAPRRSTRKRSKVTLGEAQSDQVSDVGMSTENEAH